MIISLRATIKPLYIWLPVNRTRLPAQTQNEALTASGARSFDCSIALAHSIIRPFRSSIVQKLASHRGAQEKRRSLIRSRPSDRSSLALKERSDARTFVRALHSEAWIARHRGANCSKGRLLKGGHLCSAVVILVARRRARRRASCVRVRFCVKV
jgi:hypothetical protein